MGNLYELLTDPDRDRPEEPFVRQRVVPLQPGVVTPGRVYMGSDLGEVEYTGEKPRPGDLAMITGTTARKIAHTGQQVASFREPLFAGGCRCRCPGPGGLVFYLSFARQTATVHVINGTTGELLRLVGRKELGYSGTGSTYSAAVAVDPEPPHNLYVMDDRRLYTRVRTNDDPDLARGYFGVATFVVSGGEYVFSAWNPLDDPVDPLISIPPVETDPPAIPGNCLSVIDGLPLVTMRESPARYQSLSGGIFTMHTLTLNGSPYVKKLRGNIVSVEDRPARRNDRFVIATTDDATFELVQFNGLTDEIRTVIPVEIPATARQLATVCNRLILLSATLNTFNSG